MTQKAPGKAYRQGLTLAGLFRLFPDADAAQAWFEQQRWGDEPYCPHCGSFNVRRDHAHPTMSHRCREKECRKHFSVRTASVMAKSKLDYQQWAIAIYLLTTSLKGVSSMKLHRDLGITQKSAWHLAHRLRKAWDEGGHGFPPFSGPVEVDEAYFGGKRANMSNAKRKALEGTGRGSVGKTAVVGIKDRETKRVTAKVVERTDSETLIPFVESRAEKGATVYTDEAAVYQPLPNMLNEYRHESVKHSVGEYVRGMAHTNGVESFWSMLKRGYAGTYHKMSPDHLNRYVAEFAGRHNMRPLDTLDQMAFVAKGLLGKKLEYSELAGHGERDQAVAI